MKKRIPIILLLAALLLLAACGAKTPASVESYAQEHWAQYAPFSYDESKNTLTMTLSSTMAYGAACRAGGSVYEGDLSPESHLDTLRMISLEIASACGLKNLTVTLQWVSSDGQAIFTAASDGTVWRCWDTEEAK